MPVAEGLWHLLRGMVAMLLVVSGSLSAERPVARRILVLHGSDYTLDAKQPAPPIDTMSATHF